MKYGKLSRQLAGLAGPIFIETLLVMMLGAVDTFMLSRHSDNSVAAVGLVNQLLNLIFIIFEVISLGTSILCSQYIGAGRRDKVIQTVGISLLFNLVSGLLISTGLFFFAKDLLAMMGMRADILLENGRAINMFAVNALRTAGDIYYPVGVGVVVMWSVSVLGSYILGISLGWGLVAMWFGFLLDENIRGVIFIRRWNSMKWAGKGFAQR